jgi:sulfite reductase alpha subunit-like flavoprotein
MTGWSKLTCRGRSLCCRAQRAAKAAASKEVVVLYASQTGTAQEIAKGIQAEAESQGLKAKVGSF